MKLDIFKCIDILMVAFVAFAWSTVSRAQDDLELRVIAAVKGPTRDQTLIADLWAQLKTTRNQLATIQGAQGKLQQDLTAAQVKAATCK